MVASSTYITHFGPMMIIFVLVELSYMSSVMCDRHDLPVNFVFGDSLVHTGNNDYIQTLARANYPPNGIDFPGKIPTGRFTNGLTVVDVLGKEMGLGSLTPPYLAPNMSGPVVLKGVNYASGGGGILNDTGALFGDRLNLDRQIDNFENTRRYIISSLGTANANNLLRKSLFFVNMGSNDFLNNYLVPILSAPQRVAVSANAFVDMLISKYRVQLTRLYSLGARKIVVVNVGPIGCIPYLRDTQNLGDSGCVEFANQLAQAFNKNLKNLIADLSINLSGSLFVYADAYGIMAEMMVNYKSYGFDVPDSACCSLIGEHGGVTPCGPGPSKVCDDRSKYIFWDAYHPSEAANVAIAKRLLDGNTSDVFPMNIRKLLQA